MNNRDSFRAWASRYIQTITFLGAYFLLVVLGNLIFASPWGELSLTATGYRTDLLDFEHSFEVGYWLLLMAPFAVTPPIVFLTGKYAKKPVGVIVSLAPDFRKIDFAVLFSLCLSFVAYQFWKADVAALFSSGVDAVASVEARFEIRERIGFLTFMPLQALMPFMTFFAIVRALQERSRSWWAITIVTGLITATLLTMINMKWPVLLFFLGLVAAVFMFSKRYAYLKTIVGVVIVLFCYVAISTFVFRIAPNPEPEIIQRTQTAESISQRGRSAAQRDIEAIRYAETALGMAPTLASHALNRMAISYPYYYQTFTEEGAVCGGIFVQMFPGPDCRPSTYVYEMIFGEDGFEGRGTSPMPVHVSSYAYGGWPIAIFGLVSASIILGLFAALPLDKSAIAGALAVSGAINGYHLSQIPGEGIILYEHGLLWLSLMLGAYASVRFLGAQIEWKYSEGASGHK